MISFIVGYLLRLEKMILLDALQPSTLGEAERLRKVNTIFCHIQTLGRVTAQANIRGTRNILMELHAPQLQFFFFVMNYYIWYCG